MRSACGERNLSVKVGVRAMPRNASIGRESLVPCARETAASEPQGARSAARCHRAAWLLRRRLSRNAALAAWASPHRALRTALDVVWDEGAIALLRAGVEPDEDALEAARAAVAYRSGRQLQRATLAAVEEAMLGV